MAHWWGYGFRRAGANIFTGLLAEAITAATSVTAAPSTFNASLAESTALSSTLTGAVPTSGVTPSVVSVTLNQGNLNVPFAWHNGGRYERFRRGKIIQATGMPSALGITYNAGTNKVTLQWWRYNMEAGVGSAIAYSGTTTYALTAEALDESTGAIGSPVTLDSRTPTAFAGLTSFTFTPPADGWYGFRIIPTAGDTIGEYDPTTNVSGWSAPRLWFYVMLTGDGTSNWMPVESGNFEDIAEWVPQLSSTAAGGTSNTITLNASTLISQASDIIGGRIYFNGAQDPHWVIGAYNTATRVATVDRAFTTVPVSGTGYGLVFAIKHHYAIVSVNAEPATKPLPTRVVTRFTNQPAAASLFHEMIVPEKEYSWWKVGPKPYDTANCQSYFDGHFFYKYPRWLPQFDGPRNVGNFNMPTNIFVTRHGGFIALNPWRLVSCNPPDWELKTLGGLRHPNGLGARYTDNPAAVSTSETFNTEMRGNWTLVTAAGGVEGFHEPWGFDFYLTTLTTSDAAGFGSSPNPGEPVHTTAPSGFIADTQNDRILRGWGNPTDRTVNDGQWTFQIWVSIPGADPWGAQVIGDIIFVCERKNNRISMWSALTAQTFLGYFLADPDGAGGTTYAVLDSATRRANRKLSDGTIVPYTNTTALARCQAQTCILPEGLAKYTDTATGKVYLNWASLAMGQVRRNEVVGTFPLTVGAPPTAGASEVVVPSPTAVGGTDGLTIDGNSFWAQISVIPDDDGTHGGCGPGGTILVDTWSITNNGFPQAFVKPYATVAPATRWNINGSSGASTAGQFNGRGPTFRLSYGTASAGDRGVLWMGSAGEGMKRVTLAQTSDPTFDATKFSYGRGKYYARGYHELHGVHGFGPFGFDLPWGEDTDIDYFLTWNGHEPHNYATAIAQAKASPGVWSGNFCQNSLKNLLVIPSASSPTAGDTYYTYPGSTKLAISQRNAADPAGLGTVLSGEPMADSSMHFVRGTGKCIGTGWGHNDGPGNQIWQFDLDTGLYSVTEEGGQLNYNSVDPFAVISSSDVSLWQMWGRDSEMRRGPMSTHTYGNLEYMESRGEVYYHGAAPWYGANAPTGVGGSYRISTTDYKWDVRTAVVQTTAAVGVRSSSFWLPNIDATLPARILRIQFEGTPANDKPYLIDPTGIVAPEQCGTSTGSGINRMACAGLPAIIPDTAHSGKYALLGWCDLTHAAVYTRVDVTPSPVDTMLTPSYANAMPAALSALGDTVARTGCFLYLGFRSGRFFGTRKALFFHPTVGLTTLDIDTYTWGSLISGTAAPATVTAGANASLWKGIFYDDVNDVLTIVASTGDKAYTFYLPDGVL